jgi:tetratricopeptide (TPR) repeat protein
MELFAEVGEAARGGDPSLTYASADIGRVGWHSRAKVLDLLGLVERDVAVAPQTPMGPDATDAIEAWQPDVFLLKWYVASPAALSPVHQKVVQFAPEPFDDGASFLAGARPSTQGEQDAVAFMTETGGYHLVNLIPFPDTPQFYTVYAHERARSRIARALTTIRPYSGLSHYLAGDRDHGLALLEEQLRRSPFDQIGRVSQSVRLADADRPWEALALLDEADVLTPNDAAVAAARGYVKIRQERFDEAVELLLRSVELGTSDASHFNNLGYTLIVTGQAERAVEALSQALALDPQHPLAQGNLAWARRQILERESETAVSLFSTLLD